jgi:frataxin-like iron-binding protein CyaY
MTPEQEFRKLFDERMNRLEGKIDKVADEMGSLKIKVAGISSFIGSIVAIIIKTFS